MMFPPSWATNINIICIIDLQVRQPDPIVFCPYFRALGNLCKALVENLKFWGRSNIEALMWMRFGEKVQQPQRNENAMFTPCVKRTKVLVCGIIQEQGQRIQYFSHHYLKNPNKTKQLDIEGLMIQRAIFFLNIALLQQNHVDYFTFWKKNLQTG